MPDRNLSILFIAGSICFACYVQAERMRVPSRIGHAIELIEDNYVKDVDRESLYTAAMKGVVSELDQFSEFIPPVKYEEFQEVLEQQFGGLGVLIEGPPSMPQLTVVSPIRGSPAFQAGMMPGDVIVEISGVSTEGLSTEDASKLMRGPIGGSVVLKIKRIGVPELLVKEVQRANIQVDSVEGYSINKDSGWNFRLDEAPEIAYVRITLFGEKTVEEFSQALAEVKGSAKALVIDLRFNPGGILPSAVRICDMLLDGGTIVSTKGRTNRFEHSYNADSELEFPKSIPIVVLVNGDSASASEIMAGCLQDDGRAKVAGERSYGKGTVQQIFPLDNDASALKFTTARFYRPSGKNIHRDPEMTDADDWGVTPDAELLLPFSESDDLHLLRRWQSLKDPRFALSEERPPAPEFAGDGQLKLVVEYLRKILNEPNVEQ